MDWEGQMVKKVCESGLHVAQHVNDAQMSDLGCGSEALITRNLATSGTPYRQARQHA